MVLLPAISYLPAPTAAPCQVPVLWVAPSLARAQDPLNSMDWVPVVPACQPRPLTVVLLVITVVSLLLADQDPRDLPSPSVPVPMDPVVPRGLTVVLRDLMGLTSSWAQDTRVLTTLGLQVQGLDLRHTDQWDLTAPCTVHLLTSWTGRTS